MPKNEIQPVPKPGNIAPGAELRSSLTGIDRCRSFFDRLKLIDYLKSVNTFYLENKGKIVGPISRIAAGINEQHDEEVQNFVLEGSWGGINVSLDWNKNGGVNRIYLGLMYSDTNDYYQLYLSGGTTKAYAQEGELSMTKSFYRTFRLNPPSIAQDEVDSILLNYTNELLEAKIL